MHNQFAFLHFQIYFAFILLWLINYCYYYYLSIFKLHLLDYVWYETCSGLLSSFEFLETPKAMLSYF